MIKTAKELARAALDVAQNYKTLYVMGCFGAPMTDKNKNRYINSYSFNSKDERKAKIQSASADTFGFDCVCLIKGLLWGWNGDPNQVYGGATYKSNGVPDKDADQIIKLCTEVSTDFSTIQVGECVWLPGHCGIYVGGGKAVEATYAEEDGVQIQAVLPMGQIPGMPVTAWQKHGKLPWVSYEEEKVEDTKRYRVTIEGVDSDCLTELKALAKANGCTVTVDEIATEKPVETTPEPVKPAWTPNVGDLVYFKGGLQYSSSNGNASSERPAGQAKITKIVPGKLHPYHLVKTGKTGPYGWVDRNTFEKA